MTVYIRLHPRMPTSTVYAAVMKEISTDTDLFNACKEGNNLAYARIFDEYHTLLLMKAYYILRHEQEAEDIVQEVFITLWDKKNTIQINTSLKHYLLNATRNKCINRLKQLQRQQKDHALYRYSKDDSTSFVPIENEELSHILSNAISEVTAPASRKAFELVYLEHKNHKEVANEMNITVGTVKLQVSKALKTLRQKLLHIK